MAYATALTNTDSNMDSILERMTSTLGEAAVEQRLDDMVLCMREMRMASRASRAAQAEADRKAEWAREGIEFLGDWEVRAEVVAARQAFAKSVLTMPLAAEYMEEGVEPPQLTFAKAIWEGVCQEYLDGDGYEDEEVGPARALAEKRVLAYMAGRLAREAIALRGGGRGNEEALSLSQMSARLARLCEELRNTCCGTLEYELDAAQEEEEGEEMEVCED